MPAPAAALPARQWRILLLAPFPPRLDGTHGGSRAIAHLARELAGRHCVALAYLRADDEPTVSAEIAAACDLVHEGRRPGTSASAVRPWPRALAVLPGLVAGRPLWVAARWSAGFARRVRDIVSSWGPQIVQAEFSAMAAYLPRSGDHAPPTVVTIHEPGAAAARDRLRRGERPRLFWRLDARLWERFETSVMQHADATVVFTDRDRDALGATGPGLTAERVPIGVAVPAAPCDPLGVEAPELLFFGNFTHPPNVDAATWLLEEIFPVLRRSFPRLALLIVGPNPPAALTTRVFEGVRVTGEVPSLRPYLDAAAVVIAPLRQGGGMRVKVLETLAAGKALVATPLAVEGLDIEPGRHALVAKGGAELVAAVASLLRSPELRAELARAGRERVAACYGWDRTVQAYERIYERLLRDTSAVTVS